MTAHEAAKKWGISDKMVGVWCKRGKVKAKKTMVDGRMKWVIPDDHPRPVVQRNASASEAQQKAVLRNHGKHGYVAVFAGAFSVKHMAQFMETTCAEVRAIYDDIVKEGGF